ncbi:putative succinyl-CoA transferase [Microbacterium terrae]|uniref:Succinyl-CoA transferase n=2 Tax=Microbacterium terrae TaxID=69369 RepID=A0A0M2H1R8_9MICO|nr:putative succinyl-CoA transferase [Microbacterium terrae]
MRTAARIWQTARMPHLDDLARLWPAAGVSVCSGDLELRWIDDELLVALAELAGAGIHDPGAMPFEHPWSRGAPDDVARSVLTYQWNARGHVESGAFALELGVLHRGVPVGIQGLDAPEWGVLRSIRTGSWLGRAHQGHGIGTRMRMLALNLAFDGLGAEEALSGAFADNAASNAVSRAVGYDDDGAFRHPRDGVAVEHRRYRMSRERWKQLRPTHADRLGAPVILRGVEQFRAQVTP